MRIVYSQSSPDLCQRSVSGIEKCFSAGVILWPEPLSFYYSPKGLGNVQVRRVRWNIEEKESPLFPNSAPLSNLYVPMYAGIIKYNNRFFIDFKGVLFEKVDNFLCINGLICTESLEVIVTVNHSKDIQPFGSFRWYIYILSEELPTVWNVAFIKNMRFIAVKEVNFSFAVKCFKFLQLLGFVSIELRRRDSPWTFSYTSISCANADKKRLNVKSLASLPEQFCHASLAKRTLCRSDSIALRTASSSEQSIMGLWPCPGRVCKPLMPEASNLFTQPLTLWAVISVCSPTCTELKPSDLSKMQRQRIRKQWLSPLRKPKISAFRSDSVNVNVFIFIRICILCTTNIRQFYYM